MKPFLRRLWFVLRMRLACTPGLWGLYQVVIWWGQYKIRRAGQISVDERVVLPTTEVVIDGYQGSANSFLTVAFKFAQRTPVRLAHHLHSPVQILQAVRLGKPTIVTIREPRGAALSLTSRWTHVHAEQALDAYIRFYAQLVPHAARFVISPFHYTVQAPGEPVRVLNAVFGTAFDVFAPTPENIKAVQGADDQFEREQAARKEVKARKSKEFETPRSQALLRQAEAIYQQLLAAPSAGKALFEATALPA